MTAQPVIVKPCKAKGARFGGLEYIRSYYNVAAYVDMKVTRKDNGRTGIILNAQGPYVLATMDDTGKTEIYHPNDLMYGEPVA